jgi:hypothetical protein
MSIPRPPSATRGAALAKNTPKFKYPSPLTPIAFLKGVRYCVT